MPGGPSLKQLGTGTAQAGCKSPRMEGRSVWRLGLQLFTEASLEQGVLVGPAMASARAPLLHLGPNTSAPA